MPKVTTRAGTEEIEPGQPMGEEARAKARARARPPAEATPATAPVPAAEATPAAAPAAEAAPAPAPPPAEPPAVDLTHDDDWNRYANLPPNERQIRTINKKHAAMMEAREEAAEAERFAEQQYNRAILAERRAEDAEKKLAAAAPAATQPAAPPEVKKPAPDDPKYRNEKGEFNWVRYTEDSSKFAAEEAVKAERQRQDEERAKAATAEAKARYDARIEEARKIHADYDKVVPAADIHTHRDVLNYLFYESPVPGQIAYYLAKHDDYLKRLNAMSTIAAVAEIGRLAATFEKPAGGNGASSAPPAAAPRRSGGAPPPIEPLDTSGASHIETDPSRMSFRQLREYERTRARSQRRH